MPISVASSASTTFTSGASVTVNKPSGLASGDLMVAIVGSSGTPSDKAGWTTNGSQSNSGANIKSMYKVADSTDASATNFTFTSASGEVAALILRVIGFAENSPFAGDIEGIVDSAAPQTITGSFTPPYDGSLMIMGMIMSNVDASQDSVSSYTVSGSNPSWTEYLDVGTTASQRIFGVAAATLTTARQITSFGASRTPGAGISDAAGILAFFNPRTDASGTAALLVQSPVFFAPVGSAGTSGTASLLQNSAPTFFTPRASSANPRWTHAERSTVTWTDQPK